MIEDRGDTELVQDSAYLIGLAAVAAFQGADAMSGYAWSQYAETYDNLGGYVWESDPLVGVDPTTTIKIGIKRIEFQESSLSGTNNRMIPLRGVCSTCFGYHKPWKQALAIFIIFMVLSISLSSMLLEMGSAGTGAAIFMVGTLIGLIVGFIYYFLNRTLTLGFVENSGVISGIRFKRSVIENIDVNETQACFVCELTQELIEQKIK